jgi:hypothetical protein
VAFTPTVPLQPLPFRTNSGCRCKRRFRLRWAATLAHPNTLPTEIHPASARVLSAWRVIDRSACCTFWCVIFRRRAHNTLLLLRAARLLRLSLV